jgi:uncharacterized protein (TIGR02996 family)
MIIHQAGQVFWAESDFEEKDEVKAAGFIWHPARGDCRPSCGACAAGLGKVWWTRHPDAARKLVEHADDDVRAALGIKPKAKAKAKATKPTKTTKSKKAEKNPHEAILAAPEDDAARRVLADELTDRGDPRGEFIQVQLELESASSPRREELEKRVKTLRRKHEQAWLEPIRRHIQKWTWRRGFLDHVEMLEYMWLKGGAAVLDAHPVRSVGVRGIANLPAVVASPELRRIRSIALSGHFVDPMMRVIVESPNTRHLVSLDLGHQRLGDKGLEILAGGLPALEELGLAGNLGITAAGIKTLGGASFYPKLRSLDLSYTAFEDDIMEALAATKPAPGATLKLWGHILSKPLEKKLRKRFTLVDEPADLY